jgi:hypothetical protein
MADSARKKEILRSCDLLMRSDAAGIRHVHEIRMPKAGRGRGTISRYFDDPERLADSVLRYDGDVPGIYITLNPTKRELRARA